MLCRTKSTANYFEGVIMAGGIAVLLPPQPVDPDIAESVLDSLDGLVITGGYDLDPAAYGQQPHPRTDAPRTVRDTWEFALLRGALATFRKALGERHPSTAAAETRLTVQLHEGK